MSFQLAWRRWPATVSLRFQRYLSWRLWLWWSFHGTHCLSTLKPQLLPSPRVDWQAGRASIIPSSNDSLRMHQRTAHGTDKVAAPWMARKVRQCMAFTVDKLARPVALFAAPYPIPSLPTLHGAMNILVLMPDWRDDFHPHYAHLSPTLSKMTKKSSNLGEANVIDKKINTFPVSTNKRRREKFEFPALNLTQALKFPITKYSQIHINRHCTQACMNPSSLQHQL